MKTDLQLIQDVLSGDKTAFEELMQRHDKFLLKVVVRMTRDLSAAEDIVQEALLKAYRRLALFEGRSSFRSWLCQIALNTARNRFRKLSHEVLSDVEVEVAVEAQAEKHVIALDVRGLLQREVARLPERQRMALSLRIFDDLSFKEIAELMDCPYDTAKANYRHALLKLKERLVDNTMLDGWSTATTTKVSLMELGVQAMEVDG